MRKRNILCLVFSLGLLATPTGANAYQGTQQLGSLAAGTPATGDGNSEGQAIAKFVSELPGPERRIFRNAQIENVDACIEREVLSIISGTYETVATDRNFYGEFIKPETEEARPDRIKDKYRLLEVLSGLVKLLDHTDFSSEIEDVITNLDLLNFDQRIGALKQKRRQEEGRATVPHDVAKKYASIDASSLKNTIDAIAWLTDRANNSEVADKRVAAKRKALWDGVQSKHNIDDALKYLDNELAEALHLFRSKPLFPSNKAAEAVAENVRAAQSLLLKPLSNARSNRFHELKKSKSSPAVRELAGLERRLKVGELSLIGGVDYATARYPECVLRGVHDGETSALVFDGPESDALEYVLTTPGMAGQDRYLVTGLQGLDGSGTRKLVTTKDGKQWLVIAGYGVSRHVHNAGALLNYAVRDSHIMLDRITLVSSNFDVKDAFKKGICDAVYALQKTLTDNNTDANLKQRLKRFLREESLEHVQKRGSVLCFHSWPPYLEDPSEVQSRVILLPKPVTAADVPIYIGLVRGGDNKITQVILARSGTAKGVYGETAAIFTHAFFEALGVKANPHVLFNGIAGGFQGTSGVLPNKLKGLKADLQPGGLISPTGYFIDTRTDEHIRVKSLIKVMNRQTLQKLEDEDAAGLMINSNHAAVMAPAVETNGLMEQLVKYQGISSVDVETMPIRRALDKIQRGRDNLTPTLTPIFTHSDDPLHSIRPGGEYTSLARTGPFFEAGPLDPKLREALLLLIEEATSH